MTVPVILQPLATRIGIPSLPPPELLADWCELPSSSWIFSPQLFDGEPGPSPIVSASCSVLGGELCFAYNSEHSEVLTGQRISTYNFASEEPVAVYDMTARSVSFRANVQRISSTVRNELFLSCTFYVNPEDPTERYALEISVIPQNLSSFRIVNGGTSVVSSAFSPTNPPWLRAIFHPDGTTITCQIALDCGVWTTVLQSTLDSPLQFRRTYFFVIGQVQGNSISQPSPACMSQIFVEDFDPCMIEEES
jgi:hypothetical protein